MSIKPILRGAYGWGIICGVVGVGNNNLALVVLAAALIAVGSSFGWND